MSLDVSNVSGALPLARKQGIFLRFSDGDVYDRKDPVYENVFAMGIFSDFLSFRQGIFRRPSVYENVFTMGCFSNLRSQGVALKNPPGESRQ